MKTILPIFNTKSILIAAGALVLTMGCSKTLTQQDVQDDIKDAREATQKAKEKTTEAIAAREQFYVDYKDTKMKALEDRTNDIEDRIKELKKTSKKSENRGASADIDSAIKNLEEEKSKVNQQMKEVDTIQKKDWSSSYQILNESISQIEDEIERLSQSLQ